MSAGDLYVYILDFGEYAINRVQYIFFRMLALLMSPLCFVCFVFRCGRTNECNTCCDKIAEFVESVGDTLESKLMKLTWM